MKRFTSLILAATAILTGCASVDMAPKADSDKAKQFAAPSNGNAGIYFFRDSALGAALKKDIWVNGQCVGASAPNIFFYTEVEGGKSHTLETQSEFSPNQLPLTAEAGKTYFVRQYIKLGLIVGGAALELVSDADGKLAISKLEMAKPGQCESKR